MERDAPRQSGYDAPAVGDANQGGGHYVDDESATYDIDSYPTMDDDDLDEEDDVYFTSMF